MKRLFSKLAAIAISVITVVSASGITSIQAQSVADGGFTGYWFTGSGYTPAPLHIHIVNNVPAYCIEPTEKVNYGGDVYTTSDIDAYTGLSSEVKTKLAEYSYFGYGYTGRTDNIYFAAAQKLIWQTLDSTYSGLKLYANSQDGGYVYLSDDRTSALTAAMNEIQVSVNAYEASLTSPNFVITDATGAQVGSTGVTASYDKAVVTKTYTVTDTNGVLSSKVISSNDFGDRATVSGNTVTITPSKDDLNVNHTISFKANRSDVTLGYRPMICTSNNAQNLVSRGDPQTAAGGSITLKAIGVTVKLSKLDITGEKEIAGASMSVKDKDGNVVDSWTSDGTEHESVLVPDEKYTLTEDLTPIGYYYSNDIVFTAKDGAKVGMTDTATDYAIEKVDDNGNAVAGVTLKLTDTTNNTVIDLPNKGVTTDKAMSVKGLVTAGHTYTLEETEIVAGVYKAASINFTVPRTATGVQTIKMIDESTNVAVSKVDNHGTNVVGAKMSIYETTTDEDGNVVAKTDKDGKPVSVYDFTSGKDNEDISKYVMGDATYILHEDSAPFGFEAAADQTFTVSGKKDSLQTVTMVDTRKSLYVSAVKVDSADNTKLLKGAEITLYKADGTVATDVNGNKCVGTTDGEGVITWNIEYAGDGSTDAGYYVMESKAPTGYRINTTHYAVTLSEDYNFAQDNAVKIVVNDDALPAIKMGVSAPWIAGGVLIVAIAALFVVLRKKKHAEAK